MPYRHTKPSPSKGKAYAFLGLRVYYPWFILHFTTIVALLADLTRDTALRSIFWMPTCERAFPELKSILCRHLVVYSQNFEKKLILQRDASEIGLGAVLS